MAESEHNTKLGTLSCCGGTLTIYCTTDDGETSTNQPHTRQHQNQDKEAQDLAPGQCVTKQGGYTASGSSWKSLVDN